MTPSEPTSCQACGHQPWASDRFCSVCGSRLAAAHSEIDLVGGTGDGAGDAVDHTVELEAVVPAKPQTSASGGAITGSWRRIGSALVVLVVIVAGWRLLSGADAGPDADPASVNEAAVSEAAIAEPEPEADVEPIVADETDPFDGKIDGWPDPSLASDFTQQPDGFWPEPRHVREGLTPGNPSTNSRTEPDNPPERQAALQALYAPVGLTDLNVGAGSLAVDITGGPVLVDMVSGDVSDLAGRNQLLPVGALSLSPAGVVMRFADPALFGGVNEAAGVVLPWDGGSPIELVALGWQTADRAGNQLLSFSGSPDRARYLLTDLASGTTVATEFPVAGPRIRVTGTGDIIFAAGAEVVAASIDLAPSGAVTPDVTYRVVAQGELVDAVGGFMVVDCQSYPTCELQLFNDRFEPAATQRIEGRNLPLTSVGPVVVANDGSGYARWVPSTDGDSFDLVVTGGADDRALPDLPVVFTRVLDGPELPAELEAAWAPNGNGLFLLDPRDRTLNYLSLLSGRVIELDVPTTDAFAIITDEVSTVEP